jgi:uncharacterized membrane protein
MRRRSRPFGSSSVPVTRGGGLLLGVALVGALASGCSGADREGRRPEAGDAGTGGAFPDTVRGVVTLQEAGGVTFRPCGQSTLLWVLEESGADLDVAARGLAGTGTPLYAELEAETVLPPRTGPGSGFQEALRVRRWVYLAEDTSDCGRLEDAAEGVDAGPEGGAALPAGVSWRAQGNEPFWMAEVREDRILVVRPGEDTVSVPSVEPAVEGASRRWRADTESHGLELTVDETPCVDSMSGFRFDHTARLRLDDRSYEGCARPGPGSDAGAAVDASAPG